VRLGIELLEINRGVTDGPTSGEPWRDEARWAPIVRRVTFGCAAAIPLAAVLGRRGLFGIGLVHVAGLLAFAGILVGVALHRRNATLPTSAGRVEPWLLIAAGVAILAATAAGTGAGGPSGAREILALAGYPLLVMGMLRLLSGRLPGRDADVLVQAALVATIFGLGLWAIGAPERLHPLVSIGTSVASVALPAFDLVLLTIAVRLLLVPGERIFAYRGATLAIAYLFGAHAAAALGAMSGWGPSADIVRVLLVCSFSFWALAALDPSMRRLFEPLTGDPPSFSPGHFILIEMGMLTAPVVIGVQAGRHAPIPAATAIAASLLSCVLAAYLGNLLWHRGAIERQAHHDELTGLPNRTLFADRLSRALAHARRNDISVAVMFVDLDRFKEVNDSFGHAAGDELLRQVAGRLQSCMREEDTVARLGGDEFALLMPHISGIEGAVKVAERLLAAFTKPITLAEQQVMVSGSVGISLFPQDGTEAQDLIEGADAAMYRAKEQGRNTYEIYSPALRTQAHERLAVESALHKALANDELILHYQPKVDLRTGAIIGAEALVRWNHPEKGLLFPGHFVPVAEQSGQVVALGEFVIAAACEQLKQWRSEGLPWFTVAVNVSARQLRHGLVDYVAAALRSTGLEPGSLELELTESAALESVDVTVQELSELRAMGVGCSIDDFGTGYSGLSYLSRLPIDGLKIDKSFVDAITSAGDTIVDAVIALGHSLHLKVIAEGVETADQLAYLARRGCDQIQGYLFSKPIPADDFARLVRSHRAGGPGHLPLETNSAAPIAS
jgi:diguanylate cyclase (GGDEF)-like protein